MFKSFSSLTFSAVLSSVLCSSLDRKYLLDPNSFLIFKNINSDLNLKLMNQRLTLIFKSIEI